MENLNQPPEQRPIEAIIDQLFEESDVIIHALLSEVLRRISEEK